MYPQTAKFLFNENNWYCETKKLLRKVVIRIVLWYQKFFRNSGTPRREKLFADKNASHIILWSNPSMFQHKVCTRQTCEARNFWKQQTLLETQNGPHFYFSSTVKQKSVLYLMLFSCYSLQKFSRRTDEQLQPWCELSCFSFRPQIFQQGDIFSSLPVPEIAKIALSDSKTFCTTRISVSTHIGSQKFPT